MKAILLLLMVTLAGGAGVLAVSVGGWPAVAAVLLGEIAIGCGAMAIIRGLRP